MKHIKYQMVIYKLTSISKGKFGLLFLIQPHNDSIIIRSPGRAIKTLIKSNINESIGDKQIFYSTI